MTANVSAALVLVGIVILGILLIRGRVTIPKFGALAGAWFVSCLLFYGFTSESLSELQLRAASIKRDVQAARDIKDELRRIARLIVENSYTLGQSSFLALEAPSHAGDRLSKNLDELSKFVEPDVTKEDKWWEELRKLFSGRR